MEPDEQRPARALIRGVAGIALVLAWQLSLEYPSVTATLDDTASWWLRAGLLACGSLLWLSALRGRATAATASTAAAAAAIVYAPLRPEAGHAFTPRRFAALVCGVVLVLLPTMGPVWLAPWLPGVRGSWIDLIAFEPRGRIDHDVRLTALLPWIAGLLLTAWALHHPLHGDRSPRPAIARIAARVRTALRERRRDPLGLRGRARTLAVGLTLLAITVMAGAARFSDLDGLPFEMTSDHVEKLLDVEAVAQGRRPIFLANNGGREPLQFYWTAALIALGLPLSFLTLKTGMAIVGTATVPLLFLLGRAIGERRGGHAHDPGVGNSSVAGDGRGHGRIHGRGHGPGDGSALGLAAAGLLAVAPWHLQILRTALRAGFSTAFAALGLWLLTRALTRGARQDWLWLGAATACGLYGYTGFRPFLLVIPLGLAIRLLHDIAAGHRPTPATLRRITGHVLAAIVIGAALLTPLARFASEWPQSFWSRSASRLIPEHATAGALGLQAMTNAKRALLMFNVTADSAWLHSPPGRPALEPVGGALLVIGVLTALVGARRGDWRASLLLAAVPVMLLSSAMALAFPNEVPHLTRAAGALPAVMVLAGLPLIALGRLCLDWDRARRASLEERPLTGSRNATSGAPWRGLALYVILLIALAVLMTTQSARHVFVEYRRAYDAAAQPTRAGAEAIAPFLARGGRPRDVYLVSWPYGWDHRAIAILLGDTTWSNVMAGHLPDMSDAAADAAHHPDGPAGRLYIVGGPFASAHIAVLTTLREHASVTWHRAPPDSPEGSGHRFASVFLPPD